MLSKYVQLNFCALACVNIGGSFLVKGDEHKNLVVFRIFRKHINRRTSWFYEQFDIRFFYWDFTLVPRRWMLISKAVFLSRGISTKISYIFRRHINNRICWVYESFNIFFFIGTLLLCTSGVVFRSKRMGTKMLLCIFRKHINRGKF